MKLNYPLKFAIINAGITQVELAQRLSISPTTLSEIVRGYAEPSEKIKRALARELGVSKEILFPEEG